MKLIAILAVALALVTATARATLAHPDVPGQPDPYWQQLAAASVAEASQARPDTTLLQVLVYASGGVSLLLAVSVLRSLWIARRRARA